MAFPKIRMKTLFPKIPKHFTPTQAVPHEFMTQRDGRVVLANIKPHQNTYLREFLFTTPQGEGHISTMWHRSLLGLAFVLGPYPTLPYPFPTHPSSKTPITLLSRLLQHSCQETIAK